MPETASEARLWSSQVLFTGMVDEAGEQVLARLGGSMAKGVADMNCLVTDKVRRTVKLLCAVAKGIPVVTTKWLEKVSSNPSAPPPALLLVALLLVTLPSLCFSEWEGRELPASQFLRGEGSGAGEEILFLLAGGSPGCQQAASLPGAQNSARHPDFTQLLLLLLLLSSVCARVECSRWLMMSTSDPEISTAIFAYL